MRFSKPICLFSLLALAAVTIPAAAQHSRKSHKPAHLVAKAASPSAPAEQVPVKVEFLRDIAPIIDRGGCSGAQCHGKFGGRAEFQVSLLTLNPEDDYEPIVLGARGRRINFVEPEKSLFLLKATNAVPHAGGERFAVGSVQYRTVLKWIKAGAPFEPTDPRLVTLSISPKELTLQKVGQKVPLKVTATYTDGSTRDVTRKCSYSTTNGVTLSVNDDGVVSGFRWGGGGVLARYLGTVTASFVTLPQLRKGPYPVLAENNTVDKYVFANLKRLNVLPSKLSDDRSSTPSHAGYARQTADGRRVGIFPG